LTTSDWTSPPTRGIWVQEEPLTLNSSRPAAFGTIQLPNESSYSNTWSGLLTLQRTAGIEVTNGVLHLMGSFDCCVVAYLGTNHYHGLCVNYLGDTGADGTLPFAFRVPPLTNFIILVSARATTVACPNYALELFGLPCPPPTLHIAKDAAPDQVLLQRSTAYPEYQLDSTDALRPSGPSAFNAVTNVPEVVRGR